MRRPYHFSESVKPENGVLARFGEDTSAAIFRQGAVAALLH